MVALALQQNKRASIMVRGVAPKQIISTEEFPKSMYQQLSI